MKKFRLLLLDANIVIELFELGLWERIVDSCEVLVARTVADEARYFARGDEDAPIDLAPYEDGGRITVVDVDAAKAVEFRMQFDPTYLEKLDPGETESLLYLLDHDERCLLCSSDKIVFKVLGRLRRGDQGVSLEEILQATGLARPLHRQFTLAYRRQWTEVGKRDAITDIGLR